MSTSAKPHFLSEIVEGKPIPKGKLAFFQERFRDHLYELVVSEFLKREQTGALTKAAVAQRLGKDPSQITRWLGAPGNWELDTVSDLLLAIAQAEPAISLTPLAEKAASVARHIADPNSPLTRSTVPQTPTYTVKSTNPDIKEVCVKLPIAA
jgi:hypothetical protein